MDQRLNLHDFLSDPPPDVPPGVSEPKKEKLTVPPDDQKLPASDNLKYMINTNLIRLEEKIIGKVEIMEI